MLNNQSFFYFTHGNKLYVMTANIRTLVNAVHLNQKSLPLLAKKNKTNNWCINEEKGR